MGAEYFYLLYPLITLLFANPNNNIPPCRLFGIFQNVKMFWLSLGSTDFGNVSYVVPGIHSYFYIGSDALNHTEQYTTAAGK